MRVELAESGERGAAFVEAAVIMLLLLIILFGIFEAGRMVNIQQTLTNAAREGARLSVLPLQGGTDILAPPATVRSRVRTFLDASGLNGAVVPDTDIVIVQPCCYDPATDTCVSCTTGDTRYAQVTIEVPYKILSISMFSFLQVTLRGRAIMRNETNIQ
jgi:Flp pilus assembly protein TadG